MTELAITPEAGRRYQLRGDSSPAMFLTMTALVVGQGAFLLDNANTLPADVRARGLAFTAFITGRAAILFGWFYV